MSNPFINGGGSTITLESLQNGTANINIYSATIGNLSTDFPVGSNESKQLKSSLIPIDKVINLQTTLDSKISNPVIADLNMNGNDLLNCPNVLANPLTSTLNCNSQNLSNVDNISASTVTLNGTDLNTRLTTDETNIITLQNKTQYITAGSNITNFASNIVPDTANSRVCGTTLLPFSEVNGTQITSQLSIANASVTTPLVTSSSSMIVRPIAGQNLTLLTTGGGNISITANGTFPNGSLTISGTGSLSLSGFGTTLTCGAGSGINIDANGGNVSLLSDIIPNTNATINLGNTSNIFNNVFTVNAGSVALPITNVYASTVNTQVIDDSFVVYLGNVGNAVVLSKAYAKLTQLAAFVYSVTASVARLANGPATSNFQQLFTNNPAQFQAIYTGSRTRVMNFNISFSCSALVNNVDLTIFISKNGSLVSTSLMKSRTRLGNANVVTNLSLSDMLSVDPSDTFQIGLLSTVTTTITMFAASIIISSELN
jgi:hypothetical protein